MSSQISLAPSILITQGWNCFARRPVLSIGMWVVYAIFSGGNTGGSSQSGEAVSGGVIMAVLFVVFVVLLVAGPIRGGYDMAMLRLVRNDEAVSFGDMFSGFSKFRCLLIINIFTTLAVVGGLIFFIVPGIIAMITLWPAFLLAMEDDLEPVPAIQAAWRLTCDHKTELFTLGLATIVLLFCGLFAFGVGLLITGPITQFVWIGAYQELRKSHETALISSALPNS